MTPRHPLSSYSLPTLMAVTLEIAFSGERDEMREWGTEVEVFALLAAFAVGLLFGASETRAKGWNAMLERVAIAAVGLVGAGVCVFACGWLRLTLIELAPTPGVVAPRSLLLRAGTLLVTGSLATWGVSAALRQLGPRSLALIAGVAVAVASLIARSTTGQLGVPFERVKASMAPVLELGPLTVQTAEQKLSVAGDDKLREVRRSGAVTVERDARESGCKTRVRVDGDEVSTDTSYSRHRQADGSVWLCEPVVVRYQSSLDLVTVMNDAARTDQAEVRLRGEPVDRVTLSDVASQVLPPTSWRLAAATGSAVGGLLLLLAAFELTLGARGRRFVVGQHQGGGVIVLADDRRVEVAAARELAAGPVLVHGELPAPPVPGYRERADIVSATLEVREKATHDAEIAQRRQRVRLAAMAAITVSLAPAALPLASWMFGLGR